MSSWLSSITNLSELILDGFANCQHLPPLHQLYSLKVIRLSRLEALENVSETEMQEELVSGKSTTIFFPSLEELQIDDCPNFKGWWKGDVGEASNPHLPCFPCLSRLTINHCPNLTTMPLFPSVTELELKNTSSKPFQETMKLKLTKIEAPSSILDPRSRLEYLYIDEVKDLGSMSSLHQLYSLKVIRLSRLEALENVSKTEMQEELVSGKSTTIFFPSLEELQIDDCPNLKGWWKGDVGEASNPHLPCFPCLSCLTINHCPNLTTMPLFPSVTELELKNTSSKPFQETMKLKMTKIEPPSSILHPLSKLESLEIDEVKDLDSLSSLHQLYSLSYLAFKIRSFGECFGD
ncbi:hypothetical protein ERO13_A10G015660v2 [Gossypium hirsutum]|nr:hypothetical protein ERO13_A10G015660v2 [Gossypium hirsutum]